MDVSALSVTRQCELLGFNRSWFYYMPVERPEPRERLDLKGYITQEYMIHPFYGYRRITVALKRKGHDVTQKKVRLAMGEMNMKAIYPKPNLSKPWKGHKIYKYLLRGLTIDHANQVWSTDITYIKLDGSFVYLTAVKYENIYLNDYKNLKELKGGVKYYFQFFNTERYHQSLEYATPDEVYFSSLAGNEEVSCPKSA